MKIFTRRESIYIYLFRLFSWIFRKCFGPYMGLLPRGMTCAIPEMLFHDYSCQNVFEIHKIRYASVEQYDIPEHLPSAFRREASFFARNVYSMRNVTVGIPSGICLSKDRIFLESYGNAYKWFIGSVPQELLLNRSAKKIEEDLVTCLCSTSYYHFLIEELPRLLFTISRYPNLSIMIYENAPKHVLGFVDMLKQNLSLQNNVILLPMGLYQVSNYVFTASEDDSGFFHKESINIVRDTFKVSKKEFPTGRKAYLSRKKAARSFTNETEVEEHLKKGGFSIICLEDLSIAAQINLFQNAEIIVGSHGAGFANLVWASENVRVLEIFSPVRANDCFARLASTVRAKYFCIWAQPDEGWGRVDIDSLDSMLNHIIHDTACTSKCQRRESDVRNQTGPSQSRAQI
jgi:hypothetical protein